MTPAPGTNALSWWQRGFLRGINALSNMSQGYTVSFAEELVRQHGIRGFFKFGQETQRLFAELVAFFGETDMHLVASFGSFWNGCDYCAYGHMLAYNIHILDEEGVLFPVDEFEVTSLVRMKDTEVIALLRSRLAAKHPHALSLIERQYALKTGEIQPTTDQDRQILKANALYEWVNECSIVVEAPAPPLGPIAKRKDLRQKYAQERQKERASNGLVAPGSMSTGRSVSA